jgi:uridine kinase
MFSDIKEDTIYIPYDSKIDINKLNNIDDPYICDIIAFGIPKLMNDYFNYYLYLFSNKNLMDKSGTGTTINETLLYYYLNIHDIAYQLVDMDYSVILSFCNTIAITGDSGSGKTTLSNILKKLFDNSFVLECDRYHKWERGNANWSKMTHLNPEANYITKMNNDVFDLKIGNSIYQIDYDHDTGKFTDKQHIESKDNVIICGLHSLYLKDNIVNLKIYMDVDENIRIPWKIKRDIEKRGYSLDKILKQIEDRKEDFNKYIFPQKEKADIIICFYTDTTFNISTFTENNINIFLKIGIHKRFNVNEIMTLLKYTKIEIEGNYFYFYFNSINDYEKSIKNIILNL